MEKEEKTKLWIISDIIVKIIFILVIGYTLWQILLQLKRIKPQLKEEFVSVQTVKLDGEIYICGSINNNRDKESLYCRGYDDGYSWAAGQVRMNALFNEKNK